MTAAAALAALLLATSAQASDEDAVDRVRRNAPNVVVFDVLKVRVPTFRAWGTCRVEGRIIRSERGNLFKPGDPIRLKVPCGRQGANIPPGPMRWVDSPALKRSAHGRAHLDAKGDLMVGQYELYDLH